MGKQQHTDIELVGGARVVGHVSMLQVVIDGGGSEITPGVKGEAGPFAFDAEIVDVTALADQTGSIVIDVWRDSYANFPPVDGDSITASAPITISEGTKAQDSTLTGWDTTIEAGSIFRFNVDSCSAITRVTLSFKLKRT